jgi:hypothetical protein
MEKLAKKSSNATALITEYEKLNDYKQSLLQEVNILLNAKGF